MREREKELRAKLEDSVRIDIVPNSDQAASRRRRASQDGFGSHDSQMRRIGAKQRQQRTANFMKGNTGKKKNYLAILLPCAVIFGIVLFLQRPHQPSQLSKPVSLSDHNNQGRPTSNVLSRSEGQAIQQGTEEALIGRGRYRCAVVIDAGSTGSRVHVFKFEVEGEDLTLLDSAFKAIEPGLSSFASEPEDAGKSLIPLLEEAKKFVPDGLLEETTVELRATAGLRMLDPTEVHRILEEVHIVLDSYPFKVLDDAVSVMEGSDEGVFMWVSTNYYLGNIGKTAEATASVIDLGGGSVQRAFAINGPVPDTVSQDAVRTISAAGMTYQVYVHSYLGYGLKASRMSFLKPFDSVAEGHPCITKGYTGRYHYVEDNVVVKADEEEGADVDKCIATVEREMNLEEDCGVTNECSFDGVWNGGHGGGSEQNYVSSYIVDIARDVGVIPREATKSSVYLSHFKDAAARVCGMEYEAIERDYSFYLNNDSDVSFICMDTIYAYVLLKEGFQISEDKSFTVVKQFDYRGKKVEAAWPLGAAIHTIGKHSIDEVREASAMSYE